MTIRRGRRHEITIDGQKVWLDSLNEAIALQRLIEQYGFSGKWERPAIGIKHSNKFYTPDFELAVADNNFDRTSRAILEVKQYRRECVKDTRERMCAIAKHYQTERIYLYAVKKDEWFRISSDDNSIASCEPPLPGVLNVSQLWKPMRFATTNYYGRQYYQGFFNSVFTPDSKPKRRRKTKKSFWEL
ncbi:hypothetical protein EYC59_06490 [Candidatus Saccharibacteria bacterium]|nr:MAG: hypothetical protein EYC59_06490 [Candidatus Saccharibacteria bacterium]